MHMTEIVAAEWTDEQTGETVRGTVIKQNKSSVYVEWVKGRRPERVNRRKPGDVTAT
jgi:DNA-binding IclR family transcriptional regulator